VRFVGRAQEGSASTVCCAREAIGNDRCLLMLGVISIVPTRIAPALASLSALLWRGISVIGLRRTGRRIASFGTATGVWMEPDNLLNVTEVYEKPPVDYARVNLQVPSLPEGEYLTMFGQYIIKPQLFDYLEEHIENNVRERGEFQLTSALDRLRKEDGLLGLVIDGQRFDIGQPAFYLETLKTFAGG
jgi:UTP--glucose-1-phosphate uridylyltransferase